MGFNTQSPEGGCCPPPLSASASLSFNTQSPEGGCRAKTRKRRNPNRFNTQSPEGGCVKSSLTNKFLKLFQHTAARRRLRNWLEISVSIACFNTQPPEGGCLKFPFFFTSLCYVSTHSRPKAAAEYFSKKIANFDSFNTQPPEGGCVNYKRADENDFKFQHTAARRRLRYHGEAMAMGERGFNTQPPEGGCQWVKTPCR